MFRSSCSKLCLCWHEKLLKSSLSDFDAFQKDLMGMLKWRQRFVGLVQNTSASGTVSENMQVTSADLVPVFQRLHEHTKSAESDQEFGKVVQDLASIQL